MLENETTRSFCSDPLYNGSFFNSSSIAITNCMQFTIMNAPCPLIIIFLVLIGRFSAISSKVPRKPRYFKYMTEFFFTTILIVCHIANILIYLIHDKYSRIDIICYLTEALLASSLILNCIMNYSNRISYFIRNSWDFFFWFLYVLSFIPRFGFILLQQRSDHPLYPVDVPYGLNATSFMRLFLSVFILIIKSISNKTYPKKLIYPSIGSSGRAYNPEPFSGIVSMWTLNWLNPLMWKAVKGRVRKIEDIFYVRPHESVNKNYNRLVCMWNRLKPENLLLDSSSTVLAPDSDPCDTTDRTQLLGTENQSDETEKVIKKSVNKASFALARALMGAFGSELYIAWAFMIFEATMAYASPLLLNAILAYLSLDPEHRHAWHGYLICFGFLLTPLMVIFSFNRGFYYTYHVGNRIRSAMSSLIYRKALILSSGARSDYSAGELTNLVTVDVDHIVSCASQLHALFVVIFQLCIATVLLYKQLGVAAFTGLAVVFASIPLNTFAGWVSQTFEFKELSEKDKRMKLLSEVFNGIRILKLYAWEPAYEKMTKALRYRELKMLAASMTGFGIMNVSWCIFPFLILISTLYTFLSRMVSGDHLSIDVLTPERIFVSLTLFGLIRFPLLLLPWTLNVIFMAYVSLKRLAKFLIASELDPSVTSNLPKYGPDSEASEHALEFNNVSLKWQPDSKQNVLKNVNFSIKHGSLVAVVGPVGAGKSSLISATLGEMYKSSGEIITRGSLGYVSQTPWIQQHSILGNVLFGARWNPSWYFKVTTACALREDIERMDKGDETIIGERGVNLSGGQKQRVNLARAVYQKRDIYLLDDPLSAVDAHVAKHLFDKVLGPKGLLKNSTRLVVTHSVHYLPKFDHILVLNADGVLIQQGSYESLIASDEDFFRNYIKTMDPESNDTSSELGRRISVKSSHSNEITNSPKEHRFVPRSREPEQVELVPHGFIHSNAQATAVATGHLMNIAGPSSPQKAGFFVKNQEPLRGLPGTSPAEDRGFYIGSLNSNAEQKVRKRTPSIAMTNLDVNIAPPATIIANSEEKEKPVESAARENSRRRRESSSARIRVPSVRFSIPVCEANESPSKDCDPDNNYSDDEWGAGIETPSIEVIGESLPEENVETEGVSWRSYIAYFIARSLILITVTLVFLSGFQFMDVFCTYWLRWFADDSRIVNATRQLKNHDLTPAEREKLVKVIYDVSHYYLQTYGLIGLGMALFCVCFVVTALVSVVLASARIHKRLLHRVLRAPSSFFDKVPVGRILNRFSSDIDTVDHSLPSSLQEVVTTMINTVVAVFVVIYSIKPFYFGLIMIIPIGVICFLLQKLYLPGSRQARRLHSTSKSPFLACFNETAMSRIGVSTLRAFGKTPLFIRTMNRLINDTASAWFLNYSLHRWLDIRLESVGAIFVFITSASIVYHRQDYTPGMAGLMIVFALQCSECLSWLTKNTAQVENSAVCLERVDEYCRIEQEADWNIERTKPPPYWPKPHAEIRFEQVRIKYEASDKPALDKMSLKVGGSPQQRVIGIVGRTGAGKSTLAASLFRMVEADEGRIFIDNVDIATIGLHDLRRRLRILPQEPVIFSGSLRTNLDPFEQFSDEQLWTALKAAHLEEWAKSLEAGLQFECGEGGANMSVGQRQLLCLARIILSAQSYEENLNLLVLDEATSAMDPLTDQLVMQTVLSPTGMFRKSTILIIAHRLSTIMSADTVLVMENGRVVEQGNPSALIQNSNSIFSKMNADQTNISEQ